MADIGYDKPLYILPFDHRASFEKGLFGFTAPLSPEPSSFPGLQAMGAVQATPTE